MGLILILFLHFGNQEEGGRKEEGEMNLLNIRQLFRNDRVRVCDVVLLPGGVLEVSHKHPTVRWMVGESEGMVSVRGEPFQLMKFDTQTFWLNAGETWTVKNSGLVDSRHFVFELLQAPLYSEQQCALMTSQCVYSPDVGTQKLFENEYVRLWDFRLGPGEQTILHQHTLDYVFLLVGHHPHHLIGYHPDGTESFQCTNVDGDVEFSSVPNGGFLADHSDVLIDARHSAKNGSDTLPYVELLVELK